MYVRTENNLKIIEIEKERERERKTLYIMYVNPYNFCSNLLLSIYPFALRVHLFRSFLLLILRLVASLNEVILLYFITFRIVTV